MTEAERQQLVDEIAKRWKQPIPRDRDKNFAGRARSIARRMERATFAVEPTEYDRELLRVAYVRLLDLADDLIDWGSNGSGSGLPDGRR